MTNNHQVKVRQLVAPIFCTTKCYISLFGAPLLLRTFQSLTLYSRLENKIFFLELTAFSQFLLCLHFIQILESVNAVISDDEIDVMSSLKEAPCCGEKADDNLIRLNRYPYSKAKQVSSLRHNTILETEFLHFYFTEMYRLVSFYMVHSAVKNNQLMKN